MTVPARTSLMGMPVDALTEPQTLVKILTGLESGQGGSVITAHLEILRRYCTEPEVRPLFDDASIVVADGQPLIWASRIQRTPLPERVAGSELVWSLTAECALRGHSVYLLGGDPGVAAAAADSLREVYPGLNVAGSHCPPFGFDSDPECMREIRANLLTARPDVVLVALGFPKQEKLIAELRDDLPGTWFLGIGVSLSFVAGHVERAPDWAMRMGLEWFHRLLQEPRRLFRRYVVHGLPFAARLMLHTSVGRLTRRKLPDLEPPGPHPEPARVVFHHGALERSRMRELNELAGRVETDEQSAPPSSAAAVRTRPAAP